jgi:hypothetical protein
VDREVELNVPHGNYHPEQPYGVGLEALVSALARGMDPQAALPIITSFIGAQQAGQEEHRQLLQERQDRMRENRQQRTALRQEKIGGISDLLLERARAGTPWESVQPELDAVMEALNAGPRVRGRVEGVVNQAFPMQRDPRLAQGTTPAELMAGGVNPVQRAQVSPIHVPEALEAPQISEKEKELLGLSLAFGREGKLTADAVKREAASAPETAAFYMLNQPIWDAIIESAFPPSASSGAPGQTVRTSAGQTIGQRAQARRDRDIDEMWNLYG